jgi:L-2-hydroxyglutarate oxidase LhgO
LGLDIGMQVRFGPDVEWIDEINYDVDQNRLNSFYNDIRKYIPSFDKSLLKKGYSGIRPKLKNRGEGKSDFIIQGEEIHNIKNLVNLFGIESPGLTSSLVLGEYLLEVVS